MKILQVFDFFSLPHGGGTVDVISKLSKALVERDHEVTLCTGDYEFDNDSVVVGLRGNQPTMWDRYSGATLKVDHSYFNRFGMYIVPSLRHLDIEKYDVVHFHCCRSFQNVVLGMKAIAYEVPYVVDAHGSTVDRGAKNIIRHWYDFVWGDKEEEKKDDPKFKVGERYLAQLGGDEVYEIEIVRLSPSGEYMKIKVIEDETLGNFTS